MTIQNERAFNSRRLLLGALLGLAALGATPNSASAQIPPLDALNTVGNILGLGRPQPPQPRPNMDILSENMHGNSLDICVLTCELPPTLIPGGLPSIPSQARPPLPPQARPPVLPQAPAQAPRPQGPTILLPPIQL
ncbi:MAG: hypothetical protein ACFCVD_10095 [Nodosilinea sp.]